MRNFLAAVSVSLFAIAAPAFTQPPMPQPGPEHEMLKKDVGTWDASIEMFMPSGGQAEVSKGTDTVSMMGGFWQLSEFKAEMMGQAFEGRGATTYDPSKKKYVGTWIDTMLPGYYTMEATYDPATKTMTSTMEGFDPLGQVTRSKATTEWKDPDTRVFSMYGPDGKLGMRITYKRRK
jgi:hypothetical protein